MNITAKSSLVSAKGGRIEYVSPDGELLRAVDVPPGIVSALQYLQLAPEGATMEIAEGIEVVSPRSSVGIQEYGEGAFESGANPDFRPTSATTNALQMALSMRKLQSMSKTIDARMSALQNMERIPQNPAPSPAPETDPVIEPVTPEPDPA
ncbi:hypothetical protein [Pseudogemmobacter faecipullorum]|uniref:Uncharacterized protein n=1 Tax=Pseudogemmobacter faecipullorum TaxID=2755041 RepID=A0ABS8CLP6_9RHOB|nr:hypothetical protein [Pseudogemmobacter faecipullorum]MCB5410304.1 hypothetical protein [Pseudogemmobacter faecipullorum]